MGNHHYIRSTAIPNYVSLLSAIDSISIKIEAGTLSPPASMKELTALIRREGGVNRHIGDYLAVSHLRGFYRLGENGPYLTPKGEEFLRDNQAVLAQGSIEAKL